MKYESEQLTAQICRLASGYKTDSRLSYRDIVNAVSKALMHLGESTPSRPSEWNADKACIVNLENEVRRLQGVISDLERKHHRAA